ncbi:MAG: polygalacturonase, partial [Granulosicoccus sp.]
CSLLDITQSRNVILNNWTLDDDVTVAACVVAEECPRMLHIRSSSDVTLSEMNIRNGKSYVIYVQQVNGFNFLNSSLTNSGVLGLYVGHDGKASTNVRIQHSTFNDNQTNALALLGVSGSSLTDNIISNNTFRRNHWRGQWAVAARFGTGFTGGGQVYIAQASGLTVSDNLIEDGYCENCFIQQRMGSGVSGIELAIPGRNSVTNTLITNNVVNNHDAWGIFVNQGSSLGGSVVISNNQLRNNTVGVKPGSASVVGNTVSDR